jgi:hypothetical protein
MREKIWEMRDCWTSGGIKVKNFDKRGLPRYQPAAICLLRGSCTVVVEYEDGVDHDDTCGQVDDVTGLVQDSDITRA